MTALARRHRARVRIAVGVCAVALLALCAPLCASANFPARGAVVPGQSIGNVRLGMTEARVRALWGPAYTACTQCGKTTVWLYVYREGDPIGAAVKFGATGRVVSVFTLGSPAGWGLKGVMMGDPVSNVYNVIGNSGTSTNCVGYDALTIRIGSSSTSFYSASGVIYGYALTASGQPVCQ